MEGALANFWSLKKLLVFSSLHCGGSYGHPCYLLVLSVFHRHLEVSHFGFCLRLGRILGVFVLQQVPLLTGLYYFLSSLGLLAMHRFDTR